MRIVIPYIRIPCSTSVAITPHIPPEVEYNRVITPTTMIVVVRGRPKALPTNSDNAHNWTAAENGPNSTLNPM